MRNTTLWGGVFFDGLKRRTDEQVQQNNTNKALEIGVMK